jgi:hypothetical protein
VSEQLWIALHAPGAAAVLLCCVVAAIVLAVPVARVFGWPPVRTLLALLALAPVLTFTIPPDAGLPPPGAIGRVREYLAAFGDPFTVDTELAAAGSDAERMANLLLFVPAGFFWTLAVRRGVVVALGGVVVSFGIEGWQAASDGRVASVGDWMHNSAGALLGVTTGAAVLLVFAIRDNGRRRVAAAAPGEIGGHSGTNAYSDTAAVTKTAVAPPKDEVGALAAAHPPGPTSPCTATPRRD